MKCNYLPENDGFAQIPAGRRFTMASLQALSLPTARQTPRCLPVRWRKNIRRIFGSRSRRLGRNNTDYYCWFIDFVKKSIVQKSVAQRTMWIVNESRHLWESKWRHVTFVISRRVTMKAKRRMGTLYARYKVENHVDRSKSVLLAKMLVDTGSDYRWIPATSL